MDRAVVAVTVCMGKASVIACVSSSDIILRTSAMTYPCSLLASEAAPQPKYRSAEGMAVRSISLFALCFFQELSLNILVDQTGDQRLVGKTFFEGLSLDAKQIMTA